MDLPDFILIENTTRRGRGLEDSVLSRRRRIKSWKEEVPVLLSLVLHHPHHFLLEEET